MTLLKYLVIVLLFAASTAWAGDVEDAVAAFDKKDYVTALKKHKSAVLKDDAVAQNNLGAMYYYGLGVVQDYAEAVRWYKLAAAQGYALAQWLLGIKYDNGEGVVQNYARAHMWFNLAAVSGNANAVRQRNFVASKMTPQQIVEAQKMARECQARNFKNCD